MRFGFNYIVCFLLLTTLFGGDTFGQIFRVNADKVAIMSIGNTDSIHVFYTDTTGSLKARSPFSGSASYKWAEYNISKKDFDTTTTISTDSILTGKPSGGYCVKIKSSSGKDTIYVAWVFIDRLSVKITKDSNGDNNYLWYTCEYTDFRATSSQSNFIYYNSKGQKQALPAPKFIWSSDPTHPLKLSYKDTTSWLRMDTAKGMPYEKAKFYAQVKDRFGAMSKKDSVKYSPIVCKAIIDTTGAHPTIPDPNDAKKRILSAPLTITFLNKSKNAVRYTWYFSRFENDTAKRHDTIRVTRTFTVTSPNDSTPYKVHLISQSLELCVDTTTFNIPVAPGQIEHVSEKNDSLPNYFTPGGLYNKFRVYNISIRQFKFTVFSKWGKKVYEVSGDNMLEWDGWDGDVLNTGRPASDGVYFYVLEVLSWDKTPDPKKMKTDGKYSGFFYLFRAK